MITMRRKLLDKILISSISELQEPIVDLGGKKQNIRGKFSVKNFCENVTVINIDPDVKPDIICSIYKTPLPDKFFNSGLICEVLEHLEDPGSAMGEANRLLKIGSKLIVTVPFMVAIHGDPSDYYRFTIHKLRLLASNSGFEVLKEIGMGNISDVICDMVRANVYKNKIFFVSFILLKLCKIYTLLRKETYFNPDKSENNTGYFLLLRKKIDKLEL